jgi:TRAP-type C4-dicarboxylate transport system permease large subunit
MVVASAAGCAAIGGIFKAGVWAGVIMAALVIAVVFFLVRNVSR